jgi:hypothetical protein
VPSGGARRGRRDNGLVAAEYAAVGDVDPRVGEHLLDVLAVEGIAAYLQPATDLHPVTRTTTVPARPIDRLYVDREHASTGREYLTRLRDDEDRVAGSRSRAARTPEPAPDEPEPLDSDLADAGPDDMEAEFARIVAGYDDDPVPEAAPWPAVEDVSDTAGSERPARRRTDRPDRADRRDLPARVERRDRPEPDEPSLLDALDSFGAGLPDDTERYTPPPAPPLPRLSRAAVLAILSMMGGLVALFFPDLLPVSTGMALLLGFGALLTGFVILIWRLRPGDEEDTDPDDGAVV